MDENRKEVFEDPSLKLSIKPILKQYCIVVTGRNNNTIIFKSSYVIAFLILRLVSVIVGFFLFKHYLLYFTVIEMEIEERHMYICLLLYYFHSHLIRRRFFLFFFLVLYLYRIAVLYHVT